MTNFTSKLKITRNFKTSGTYPLFQTAVLGLSVASLLVSPNVLAQTLQNRADFNVSVYSNVIKGDGTAQLIKGDANKRNIIFGMEGDDRINAGPSGDLIFGNQGRDTIYGGRGDDYMFGGKGLDYLYGGTGNNTIYADLDGALIWGGKGKNNIYTMPVNRPGDSVYPISYVKTGPNSDNVFVELPDPSEKNGMVFIHNDKNSFDNLTMDNRYSFIQSCFIDTNQNNQTYRWNFYSFGTPTNGQKVGMWILGNVVKPNYAPVSIRNYQAPTTQSTVNMANSDANNLKQDFKIPFFDMTNTKTIDNVINDCNQSNQNSQNRSSSAKSSQKSENYYSSSNYNNNYYYSNSYKNNHDANYNYNNNYNSNYNYTR